MSKYIYNNSGVEKTYAGVPIPASSFYQIPPLMLGKYSETVGLQQDILSGTVQMSRDGSSVISDVNLGLNFLKSLDTTDSEGFPKVRTRAFNDTDSFFFRGKGISGTAVAGQVTNVQYKITAERWINGAQVILSNHSITDSLKFQIVDVDNILGYGAGLVLNTFADTWGVLADKQDQGIFKIEYPARIPANLYVRIEYTSTGNVDVVVLCNLFLHEKVT